MKRYHQYKKVDISWLEQVPSHWTEVPLKMVASCNDEVLPESTPPDRQINYVEISDVSATTGIENFTPMLFAKSPSRARRVVRNGDILVSTVRTYLKAIASVQKHTDNLVASTGFAVIRPRSNNATSEYLGKVALTDGFIGEIISRSVGVSYPAINASEIMHIKIPLPPVEEQQKIAQFLDYETAKIDALIDEQKRLVELLKEKRQAVISHAVTKGLNPDAPMKDSGVKWLGEVPVDWSVTKLKNYCSALPGFAFSSNDFTPEAAEQKLLRGINVGVGSIRWNETVYLNTALTQKMREYHLTEGDIVIGLDRPWIGDGLRISRVTASDLPALLVQRVASLKPSSLLRQNYLYLTLTSRAFKSYIEPDLTGVSVPHLSTDQILNYTIALPPLLEQQMLCEHVQSVLDLTDNLIRESSRLENILKERRSALISAAVTGKIDVRDWQPPQGSDTVEKKESAQTEMQHA